MNSFSRPITIIILTMNTIITTAQDKHDINNIENCIVDFAQAGDDRDIKLLDKVMHPEFRSVLNRLMGSDLVTVLSKQDYLSVVEQGKIGGDKRAVMILSLDIMQNSASAKVGLKGSSLTFYTYYHLIKSKEGHWQLLNDLPYVEKNK